MSPPFFMQEVSVDALVKTRRSSKTLEVVDGRNFLITSKHLNIVQMPPKFRGLRKGVGGIFSQTSSEGIKHWLLFSIFLDESRDHVEALNEYETGDWEINWLGEVSSSLLMTVAKDVGDPQFLRSVNLEITKEFSLNLFTLFGDPYEEASWLASALLPRRLPAALRWIEPDHIQFWITL